MKQILFPFVCVLFVAGCSRESNPVATETESDKALYQQIIGKWGDGTRSSFRYAADRTWVDSVYRHYSDSGIDEFQGVAEGKYSIVNGVLYHTDIHITFCGSIFSVYGEPARISIDGSTMERQLVRVFTPGQPYQPTIDGEWNRMIWFAEKSGNTQPTVEGKIFETYIFSTDSGQFTVRHQAISSAGSSEYSSVMRYRMNNDRIIVNDIDTIHYAITGNQLYLYPSYPAIGWVKK